MNTQFIVQLVTTIVGSLLSGELTAEVNISLVTGIKSRNSSMGNVKSCNYKGWDSQIFEASEQLVKLRTVLKCSDNLGNIFLEPYMKTL